jgi:hypothetical protein
MLKYFIFIAGILLFADNVHAQVSYEYDLAGNRIKRLAGPDLSPTHDIDASDFPAGSERDFVVNLYEVNNVVTTGVIRFRVSKLSSFTITYPVTSGISNVFGGTANQNGNWDFTENSGFITATSKSGIKIPAGGMTSVGFHIAVNNGVPSGNFQNLTTTILAGSGGEINTANNQAVTVVVAN